LTAGFISTTQVHKSQGLTLQRATYDAGNDEWTSGLTFVALTRVRHPAHFAFSPMPASATRLTSEIAALPALFTRKLHEHTLRTLRYATADRYDHLSPPASARAQLPPKPRKYVAPEATQSTPSTGLWQSRPKPGRLPLTSLNPLRLPETLSVTAEALTAALRSNEARIEELGLPPLKQPLMTGQLPSWLSHVLPQLELRARVVDYWADQNVASQNVVDYVRNLGFEVSFDRDAQQEPSACAFVAARVVNDLHAAGETWATCNVRRAADHHWVQAGNLLLGRTSRDEADCGFMASNEQVDELVRGFWQNDVPGERRLDTNAWYPIPGASPLDAVLAEIVVDLHRVAIGGPTAAALPLQLRVPNTEVSTSKGLHWFTIAYTIRWRVTFDGDFSFEDGPDEAMYEDDEMYGIIDEDEMAMVDEVFGTFDYL
jgi:hypothetical protein